MAEDNKVAYSWTSCKRIWWASEGWISWKILGFYWLKVHLGTFLRHFLLLSSRFLQKRSWPDKYYFRWSFLKPLRTAPWRIFRQHSSEGNTPFWLHGHRMAPVPSKFIFSSWDWSDQATVPNRFRNSWILLVCRKDHWSSCCCCIWSLTCILGGGLSSFCCLNW